MHTPFIYMVVKGNAVIQKWWVIECFHPPGLKTALNHKALLVEKCIVVEKYCPFSILLRVLILSKSKQSRSLGDCH